jgi:type III pantothenate kinase
MNLVIDIGNTQTKLAVFSGKELVHNQVCLDISATVDSLFGRFALKNSILSNVSYTDTALNNYLSERTELFIELNEHTPLPFENLYKTKDTLGRDRIAAAAGAMEMFPWVNVLVIDMGTAITIDLITSQNQFLGGNISPGLNMRFQALHQNTASLPLLQPEETNELLGRSTSEAIQAGVINGIIFEISEYINCLSLRYHNLKIILTGGDAHFFVRKLKNHIFVDLNLILKGLNRILEYNEQLR